MELQEDSGRGQQVLFGTLPPATGYRYGCRYHNVGAHGSGGAGFRSFNLFLKVAKQSHNNKNGARGLRYTSCKVVQAFFQPQ